MTELHCEQDDLCYELNEIVQNEHIPEGNKRIDLSLEVDTVALGLQEESIFIQSNTIVGGYIKGSEKSNLQLNIYCEGDVTIKDLQANEFTSLNIHSKTFVNDGALKVYSEAKIVADKVIFAAESVSVANYLIINSKEKSYGECVDQYGTINVNNLIIQVSSECDIKFSKSITETGNIVIKSLEGDKIRSILCEGCFFESTDKSGANDIKTHKFKIESEYEKKEEIEKSRYDQLVNKKRKGGFKCLSWNREHTDLLLYKEYLNILDVGYWYIAGSINIQIDNIENNLSTVIFKNNVKFDTKPNLYNQIESIKRYMYICKTGNKMSESDARALMGISGAIMDRTGRCAMAYETIAVRNSLTHFGIISGRSPNVIQGTFTEGSPPELNAESHDLVKRSHDSISGLQWGMSGQLKIDNDNVNNVKILDLIVEGQRTSLYIDISKTELLVLDLEYVNQNIANGKGTYNLLEGIKKDKSLWDKYIASNPDAQKVIVEAEVKRGLSKVMYSLGIINSEQSMEEVMNELLKNGVQEAKRLKMNMNERLNDEQIEKLEKSVLHLVKSSSKKWSMELILKKSLGKVNQKDDL